jgi:hypothetical protein
VTEVCKDLRDIKDFLELKGCRDYQVLEERKVRVDRWV